MAQTLNEAKYSSLSIQTGLVDATLNEHEWKWLSDQTGLTDRSLNELWIALLSSMGYTTGNLNERQMKSWADMGAPAGTWNEMAYWFYTDGNASYGPTVIIQRNLDPGFCEYEPPDTVFCAASETYTAIDRNFSGSPLSYSWSVTGGTAIITGSNVSQTCTVETQNSGDDQTFELSVTVSNADPETADRTTTFTQKHTDANVAPAYIGPDIANRSYQINELIEPIETFGLFTGTNLEFELYGTWPAGFAIDSATGQITGTPTGPEQPYPNLQIQVSNSKGLVRSGTFTIALISSSIAPVWGSASTLGFQIGELMTQYPMSQHLTQGTNPITYVIETGALPVGLTMNSAGQVNGTPTTEEVATFTVRATNTGGFDISSTFTWTAWEAIVFDTIADREYQLNVPVSVDAHTFLISGTVTDWTLLGTWPPGFAIDSNGIITGTPTVDETYTGLQLRADNPYQSAVDSNVFTATTGEPVTLPAFYALTPDPDDDMRMVGVRAGVGDLTTTHTSDLYAPDMNGVYQKFPANAPVWSGGRCVLSGGAGSDVVSVHANDGPAGTPLADVPYLQYYPAAENACLYSRDLTGASWTVNGSTSGTPTFDQIGLTGEPNTASLVTDNSATNADSWRQSLSVTANTDTHVVVCYIKKDTDQTRFPEVHIRWQVPLGGDGIGLSVNTETGASVARIDSGGINSSEVADAGDWWKVILSAQNIGSELISIGIFPAAGNTLGSIDNDAQGSIIVGNVELHL